VTIPVEFRQKPGIDKNTILCMELKEYWIENIPIWIVDDDQVLKLK